MFEHETMNRRTLLKLMAATGVSAPLTGGAAPAAGRGRSRGVAAQSEVSPFEIRVSDADLADLNRRLAATRWPTDTPDAPWTYGTDRAFLETLVAYWRDEYDWRAHETALNAFDHYTTEVDGQPLHFVHQRASNSSAVPLLMTHGWPGTVWEMLPSVMALRDPGSNGGDAADAFHVIVPSIPGFGFSGEPALGTDIARTAELWIGLMDTLGYKRFGAYGSDWGAGVTRELGARFPDRLIGIHTPGAPPRAQRDPSTAEERDYLARAELWSVDETGYQRIQGTKPQTLAYGLTDSPVGVAAWITEKLRSWSDCGGDVETRFSKDQILTLVSIYWHTRTIGTSVRYYYANGLGSSRPRRASRGPVQVPQGFAQFLGIPSRSGPPRSYIEELPDNVTHWSVFDTGGHFPAIEEPDLLVHDLRTFFRTLR
ncbi:MAG: epoxide hydrolase [Acidobacteriota bacterium]|nr:epoxide hydrolase [Acidobacteriota bacterium]